MTVRSLHLAVLSALAVAHPLFEVIRRDSEFLVAHRTTPGDLFAFVLAIVVVVPAVPILLAWIAGRLWPIAARLVLDAVTFLLVALLALQGLNAALRWPAALAIPIASSVAAGVVFVYQRSPAVRSYVSLLAVALLAVPAIFLLDKSVASFWRTGTSARPTGPSASASTPIVLIVFDQFPLVSLLDEAERIDPSLFPSLADLASHSTLYRNATAVSERTGHALPAILTGLEPRRNALPRVQQHPNNLFTWLGHRYRIWAREPLTSLCPADLCAASMAPATRRMSALLSDVAAVYLHIVAPPDLRERLPPVNQGWRDFRVPLWRRRFVQQRGSDRRLPLLDLIGTVSAPSGAPPLYFVHVLLPHEPFVYYPSGRMFASPDEPILGLKQTERWTTDLWPVALSYQRHLAQVRMVDGLVGALVARLKEVGLYDSTLLVLTADHGASFRPGANFKGPENRNFADIMSVPLIVKLPGQTAGRVDDTNAETIDVLPTIADAIGEVLPWRPHGVSLLRDARRPDKRICNFGCTEWQVRTTEAVRLGRVEAIAHKMRLFGSPANPDRLIVEPQAAALVGRPVDPSQVLGEPHWQVRLDVPFRATGLNAASSFVPGLLSGGATRLAPGDTRPLLAVAVDGVVRGLSPIYSGQEKNAGFWAVLIPEEFVASGTGRLETFEVLQQDAGRLAFRRTDGPSLEADVVNLVSDTARDQFGVKASGLYALEPLNAATRFRWTGASARLEVPLDAASPIGHLDIGICQNGPPGRRLRIRVNDCDVYSGPMPPSSWRGRFDIERCVRDWNTATIELTSDPFVPQGGDSRTLGVALDQLALTP